MSTSPTVLTFIGDTSRRAATAAGPLRLSAQHEHPGDREHGEDDGTLHRKAALLLEERFEQPFEPETLGNVVECRFERCGQHDRERDREQESVGDRREQVKCTAGQTETGGSEDPEDRSVADALTEAEHFEQGVVPVDERITEIARVEQPDQQGQPCATDRTDRDAGDQFPKTLLVLGHAFEDHFASDEIAKGNRNPDQRQVAHRKERLHDDALVELVGHVGERHEDQRKGTDQSPVDELAPVLIERTSCGRQHDGFVGVHGLTHARSSADRRSPKRPVGLTKGRRSAQGTPQRP